MARRKLLAIAAFGFVHAFASGFTLLFSPPAQLPATVAEPEVTFLWDGKAPPLAEKDTFRDGAFAGMPDQDVMRVLIGEAMATWGGVAGSYVRLVLTEATAELAPDKSDHVNMIVVAATNNLNSAAYASPVVDSAVNGGKTIVDCDITVGTPKVTIQFLRYALTHELGHCLGLGHAHDNYHALMGYSRTPGTATLGADDKAGLIYLYPDPAYGDPATREVIAAKCGTVGEGLPRPGGFIALLALLLPLIAAARYQSRVRSSK